MSKDFRTSSKGRAKGLFCKSNRSFQKRLIVHGWSDKTVMEHIFYHSSLTCSTPDASLARSATT